MKKVLCLLAIGLLSAGVAVAQTGGVTGAVVDETGAAVENARVSLQNETGCVGFVLTDADGVYLFEEVPVGIYTVKAGLPQVGNASIDDIEVVEGLVTQVPDLVLVCGGGGGGGQGPHGPKYYHRFRYQGGE